MKKIIILVTILFISICLKAQNGDSLQTIPEKNSEIKTIFGSQGITHGGFGAFSFNYTKEMLDRNALLLGARGGWIMNHWFSFGLGGYGLVTRINKDFIENGNIESYDFQTGYGGLFFEFAAAPKFPVHLTFPVLLGVGGCAYFERTNTYYEGRQEWEYDYVESDAIVVIEPGVNLELNIVKSMRLGFGATYRYVEDLVMNNTSPDAMNGLSFNFTMKFGKF